jgi:ribosomal peptide maturation radical SAM protein 1
MKRELTQCDVLLVSVPFGSLNSPSLALATLKGQLHARGIATVVRHAGFEFARRITYPLYSALVQGYPISEALAGEWVFCHLATPQSLSDDESYEKYARAKIRIHCRGTTDASAQSFLDKLRAAKIAAEEYTSWLARSLCQHRPRIVGFTSTFQQHQAALAVIAKLKAIAPNTVVVMGGANCEGKMGLATLRRYPALDAVFSGEADEAFPDFCTAVLASHAFPSTNGVLIREADGRLSIPPQLTGRLVRQLDENPIPEFDDYFSELEKSPIQDEISDVRIPFETSRGCWWGEKSHCTFCGLNGSSMKFRSKSADRAIAEICHLLITYGNRPLAAVDNIIDHSYLSTVLPRLKERIESLPVKPQIFFETKSNLNREQVWALSDAGINEIQPGIESLNSDILRLMRKGVSSIRNIALLKYCAETGTTPHWNLLFGFPGESAEQYREMISLMPRLWHLYPPGVAGRIRIDRFSPYFTAPNDFGLGVLQPAAAYKHIYGVTSMDLDDIAYFFEQAREASGEQVDGTALTHAVDVWKRNYEACDRFYTVVNGRTLVCMFSPDESEQRMYMLNEMQSWLVSKCIQPASRITLRGQFERDWSHSEEQLASTLKTLAEHDIVLFRDGYYLSLPLELGRYQPRVSALHALKRMLDSGDVIEFSSNGEFSMTST